MNVNLRAMRAGGRYTEDWPKYNQEMYYAAPPPGTTLEEHMAEQVALPDYTCAAPECENHAASLCSRCHKVRYCSDACARRGFLSHFSECSIAS